MYRGARLFCFINKAAQLLHSPRSQPNARELLCDLVERNLEFLRSFPEYSHHVASLQIANEFAHLPNEVINDVVVFAAETQDTEHVQVDLQFLKEIQGSWGQLAQQQILFVLNGGRLYSKCYQRGEVKKVEIQYEEIGNQRIKYSKFTGENDLCMLRTIGANLQGSIEFENVGKTSDEVFDFITGYFTKISWRCGECTWRFGNRLQRGAIDFIKRQLQSKHLMELTIAAKGLESGELDQLLVNFVQKPYKSLTIAESDNHISTYAFSQFNFGSYRLPFQVFEEACKTWEATRQFAFFRQEIVGAVSDETFNKIKNHFKLEEKTYGECSVHKQHPHVPSGWMKLRLLKEWNETPKYVTLIFENFVTQSCSICAWF